MLTCGESSGAADLGKPTRRMDCRVKPGNDEAKNAREPHGTLVIARSESDEAIQSGASELDCLADARNDEPNPSRDALASELCERRCWREVRASAVEAPKRVLERLKASANSPTQSKTSTRTGYL